MSSGINMDAVKARLNKLKKSNEKSDRIWKPTNEKQTIRIVPYTYQPDNPFIELYFHYNLAGKSYISPISYGQRDPIMEVAEKLKSTGDKEDWKDGRALEPKLRTFAPIIIRGQEHEGVKFWGFGRTVYEYILQNIADPDCGDITHPVTGRDIDVWTEKEEGKSFPTPKVIIKMKESKVIDPDRMSNAKEIIEKITKHQTDIKEMWEVKSYEELKVILQRHLNPEEDQGKAIDQESDSENSLSNKKSDDTNDDKPNDTGDSVGVEDDLNSTFEDLFKD